MRWTGTCKALGGEGNNIALAAEFVINIIADDQIGMNANVLVRTEQGVVLRGAASRISPNLGTDVLGLNIAGKPPLLIYCLPCDIIIPRYLQEVNSKIQDF